MTTTATQPPSLVLHNGQTAQPLQAGQAHKVKAKAGERYRVLERQAGGDVLHDNVIARRQGDDLRLRYADGTELTLEGYYSECKAATACDIALSGGEGGVHKPGAEAGSGPALADGTTLVYAHGAADALMTLAGGDAALQSALKGTTGEQVRWLPPATSSGTSWGLPLTLLGGGALVALAAQGDSTAPALPKTPWTLTDDVAPVSGSVADMGVTNDARPTFAGSGAEVGATVTLREGSTVLGTTQVAADGRWQLTLGSDLVDGSHRVSYTLTDAAGNQSAASPGLDFTVDTVAPRALGVALEPADDGNTANGVDLRVTLAPDARAGDTVATAVSRDGVLVQTVEAVLSAADIQAGHLLAHVDAASVALDGQYSARTQLTDAAGNTGQAVSQAAIFTVFTGLVHDDYLANALVFVDSNLNSRWDAGEVTTRTDASGQFRFAFDPNGAPVLAMGGVDTASGAANSAVIYKAYSGVIDAAAAGVDLVLSPLSTLIAAVAAQSTAAG